VGVFSKAVVDLFMMDIYGTLTEYEAVGVSSRPNSSTRRRRLLSE
jgi:hypothetical protein